MATTSTVVVSFVIPLCLLVRNLAEERAMAAADQEARNVAMEMAGREGEPDQVADVLAAIDARGAPDTGVLLADGTVLGDDPGLASDPDVQRAADQGESFSRMDHRTGSVLIPVLVQRDDGDVGTAVIRSTVTEAELHQGVRAAYGSIIGLGAALMALSLVVAFRFGRRISEPLRDVAGVAHQLREGDLDARARVRGTEETRELARALNGLADRTTELLAAERAAVGDLSHRLRTPVTALRLDAEAVTDPELASRLQEHIATLQVTIDAIVTEARRPVRADLKAACDATATVRDRVAFWQALAEDQGREMRVAVPAVPCRVPVAEDDLADVVDVLIDNVFAHTPDGTAFEVRLSVVADRVTLTVVDEGPGMSEETRADRPGSTGLGLDIARRVAEGSGGELWVHSGTAGGARVELGLPLSSE
ncbi:MAG: HAMP domain-containing sensor histidine kinase [Nocardioidaceae bacterium]